MSKLDVFDEWGNKVGEFIPSGEDGTGLFGCLFIAVLFVVGLPIYGLVWLTKEGFAALKEGKTEEALACWLIPLIIVICLGCAILNPSEKMWRAHRQQEEQFQEEQERRYQLQMTESAEGGE